MRLALDILTVVLVSAGGFFFMAGTIGLLRFPDTLTRLHALTKVDNLGLGLIVFAASRESTRWAQAGRHLATRSNLRRNRFATYRASDAALRTPDMTPAFAFEIVLAGLLLAIATWTILARRAFAAVVLFMVFGLLLAIVWVNLSAVDVALTEAAIGGGVTSMVLLGAASRLRGSKAAVPRVSLPFKITAGVFCALVSAALATVVFYIPDVSLAPMAKENLAESGLGNPVAAVLFVFRALDTLLEKVVLLLALVGVWSLASDRAWNGVPALRVYESPSRILVFLATTRFATAALPALAGSPAPRHSQYPFSRAVP